MEKQTIKQEILNYLIMLDELSYKNEMKDFGYIFDQEMFENWRIEECIVNDWQEEAFC